MRTLRTLCTLALLAAASSVAAQPKPPDADAKRYFEEGTKAFNLGEFPRAITAYKAAYNAKPDPVFLYNIAQAYRLGNDLPNALFFYRSFLRNLPDAPNRVEVEGRIRRLEGQLEENKQIVTTPPNLPVDPSRPMQVEPAPRAVEPAAREPKLAAVVASDAPQRDTATPIYRRWWLWTIVGVVAVAAIGVGLGVALSSDSPPGSHFGLTRVF